MTLLCGINVTMPKSWVFIYFATFQLFETFTNLWFYIVHRSIISFLAEFTSALSSCIVLNFKSVKAIKLPMYSNGGSYVIWSYGSSKTASKSYRHFESGKKVLSPHRGLRRNCSTKEKDFNLATTTPYSQLMAALFVHLYISASSFIKIPPDDITVLDKCYDAQKFGI